MALRYLDVCSGISAPTMAWRDLGWTAAGYSEIEKFPRAVLAERYGAVPVEFDHRHVAGSNVTPLFGDFTRIEAHHVGPIDLLVGGTPCQDFSVAGLRAGLDGDRGNLSLEFCRLVDRTRPRWIVWENVPGVLSIDGGRAFGAILGALGALGYGFAYRVLDAQYLGVPQRRRRVFVVGYLGDWRRAAAVLFEQQSLLRHPAPRRETGKDIAPCLRARANSSHRADTQAFVPSLIAKAFGGGNCSGELAVAACLVAKGHKCDFEVETFITHSLRGEGFDASEDGTGRGTPLVAYAFQPRIGRNGRGDMGDVVGALAAQSGETGKGDAAPCVAVEMSGEIAERWAVRRLTPTECHRLQGFPDDHCAVTYRGKPAADGPQYKALGNSMAVPVVRWIGERIAMVDALGKPRP